MSLKRYISLAVVLSSLFVPAYAQSSRLAIRDHFHIKSGGSWDFLTVSPLSDALYVSHGTQVNILDKKSGDSLGVFRGTYGVHGIVFAPECNKGFISNGKLNNLFVFDASTNRILDSIRTGDNPDAMCYDSYTRRVVVGNAKSKDLTIVDAATNKVLATIALGGKPEASVSDGRGKVFVDIEDRNQVAVLDIQALRLTAYYPLKGGEEPAGLAMDPASNTLFVGCGNKQLVVLDAASGLQKAILAIGGRCDGVVFDEGRAYASNGDGTLTVIYPARGHQFATETLTTRRGSKTIAVDPATHLLYLPGADFEPQSGAGEKPRMIPGTLEILVLGRG